MTQPFYGALFSGCLIAIISGLPLSAALASNTFFKCTATNGATQYTQRAVTGQKCSLLRVDGTPASALEVQQKLADQRNLSRAAANQPATSAAPATAAAATPAAAPKPAPASKEQCEQINQAREKLEQGGRLYESDEKGERRYITEEQRQARIQEYQNTAKTRCS